MVDQPLNGSPHVAASLFHEIRDFPSRPAWYGVCLFFTADRQHGSVPAPRRRRQGGV